MCWMKTVAVVVGAVVAGCADNEREFRVDMCPTNQFVGLSTLQLMNSLDCVTGVTEHVYVSDSVDVGFALMPICEVETGVEVKNLLLRASNGTNYCIWAVKATNSTWYVVGDVAYLNGTVF